MARLRRACVINTFSYSFLCYTIFYLLTAGGERWRTTLAPRELRWRLRSLRRYGTGSSLVSSRLGLTHIYKNVYAASLDEEWSVDSGESLLGVSRSVYSPIPLSDSHILYLNLSRIVWVPRLGPSDDQVSDKK
ncbi:hypothetical protein B296_00003253 [Ensete ventricosum]|uniref:Uncharacterized protein n=1 Tax=Ensete ventricosum TaxID=4639 RepID=A0A427AG40_ENSVE|nr:hypothetical protein B296_00003253 [Ensete ventricosum]